MSDFNPIKNVNPPYPVKPVQPARKDRESGKPPADRRDTEQPDKDDDNQPLIDEYV